MEVIHHPRACAVSPRFAHDMRFGWTAYEETELLDGILFQLGRMPINNAKNFNEMLVEVANFLKLTLLEKSRVDIIRWKLRHLVDTYRQFKMFLFFKPGVKFNISTNAAHVARKYWSSTTQESELDAYFRTHGFRLYSKCWYVFDRKGLDQYASYIDEAVHAKIPLGVEPPSTNLFYYFLGRGVKPRVKKNEGSMRYKDMKVNAEDLDEFFFRNGWDPDEEIVFVENVFELCKHRTIQTQEKYDILVEDLVRFYDHRQDIHLTELGIREKLRSLAYVFQLFKRFLFETVGVHYNFSKSSVLVDEKYWECEGKEPLYKGWFRGNAFNLYQDCYKIFEVKGLDRFAYGIPPPIDPIIPEGVDLTYMLERPMYKSYYRSSNLG